MTEERGLEVQSTGLERVLMLGDLKQLNPEQRVVYAKRVCDSLGLNLLTKPFDYLELNGKLVLYATRSATDQLRKINGVSITALDKQTIGDLYVVTAQAADKQGRTDASTGAVAVAGLRGDKLANAIMKAETKAKRRVTLSLCGLGMLDESEIETIPEARTNVVNVETGELQLPGGQQLKTADQVQDAPPASNNGNYQVCPKCRQSALMKSRYDEGYYCNPKVGGCEAKLTEEDLRDDWDEHNIPPVDAYQEGF